MRLRLALGAVGVAAALFGLLRFLELPWARVLDAVGFLVGGVVLHDGVLAPLTIALTVLGTRFVPRAVRVRLVLGMLVLVTVTVGALPALLRLGARPDNPTLLDRDYLVGWLLLAAVVLVGTLLLDAVLGRRRRRAR